MSARKKTPFQKHREEEEAKKKRAEDETARLYQEFVESFQADNTPGSKAFVRGGTINPNEKLKNDSIGGNSKDEGSGIKKGSRYVPSFIPPPMATKGKEYEKKSIQKEEKPKEREKGKSRNIDHFMEELKHEQEMRERRNQDREYGRDIRHVDNSLPSSRFDELPDEFDPMGRPGSFDDGDPQTTNLYVGNLSPQVDENFLLRTFGRFGPIASVKIMWPRTEEERRRQRNCGFVAFMNRTEAQAAKDEMQGVVVYEYELKIGWGKSVSLPSQALPAPPPGHMAIRSKEGATVILSGPSGPPVTAVPSQNSELVFVSRKRKLQAAKQKRELVLAEVRFLRRKHKYLLKKQAPNTDKETNTTLQGGGNPSTIDQSLLSNSLRRDGRAEEGKGHVYQEDVRCKKQKKNHLTQDKAEGEQKICWPDQVTLNV